MMAGAVKRFHFVHVEPDEVTQSTYVDIYSGVFRQRNLDHGMRAGWTSTSGFSFAFDCVEPKWIDRLGRKCAPQELEADRTPTTGVARPKKAIRHTHLFQRQIAPRTE